MTRIAATAGSDRLFYKKWMSAKILSQKGALVGDVIMSIITTCLYERLSTHEYFTILVAHAAAVKSNPANWLPWNYKATLAESTS